MIIRILLLIGIAATGWLIFLRRNKLPLHIMTVFGLLAAGAAAVIRPDLADQAAHFVGVGRGADFVFYVGIIGVFFVLMHYYTKFVEMQQQITDLTRELAILRSDVERTSKPTDT